MEKKIKYRDEPRYPKVVYGYEGELKKNFSTNIAFSLVGISNFLKSLINAK